MTRSQQAKFIRDLSRTIAEDIIQKTKSVPETKEWNGHEFRVLLSERHADSAHMSEIKIEPKRARAMAYRNTVTINNL